MWCNGNLKCSLKVVRSHNMNMKFQKKISLWKYKTNKQNKTTKSIEEVVWRLQYALYSSNLHCPWWHTTQWKAWVGAECQVFTPLFVFFFFFKYTEAFQRSCFSLVERNTSRLWAGTSALPYFPHRLPLIPLLAVLFARPTFLLGVPRLAQRALLSSAGVAQGLAGAQRLCWGHCTHFCAPRLCPGTSLTRRSSMRHKPRGLALQRGQCYQRANGAEIKHS